MKKKPALTAMDSRKLHHHFMTEIIRADEPETVIGLTVNSAEEYEKTADIGDLLALIPVEGVGGNDEGERVAKEMTERWNGYPALKRFATEVANSTAYDGLHEMARKALSGEEQ